MIPIVERLRQAAYACRTGSYSALNTILTTILCPNSMPPLLRIGFILAFFNYVLSEASSRREKFGRSNLQRESYAPFESPCPSNDVLIRSAKNQSLSEDEVEFVDRHQANTQEDWSTWLKSSNPGPDLEALIVGGVLNYTSSVQRLPRIGLALSGDRKSVV